MYLFEKPLIRGTLLKRKSQFTALIDIDGEELIAHIPTTNRIGDVENWKSQELDLLRKNFGNKRNFNSMFVKMNEIRNKVMHPSRGSLDDDEKMALVDFYIVLKKS